jgi:heterodisulfide reductase subunit C
MSTTIVTDNESNKGCAFIVSGSMTTEELRKSVKKLCDEDVLKCYQCGECTAGCPAAFCMDIAPNQIIRMVQLGMMDEVLKSSSIWVCASCETCATRCPKGVSLAKVMDACKQIAIAEGVKPKEGNVKVFHEEFLNEVQRNGRVHELTMIGFYKMRTLRLMDDVWQGIQMVLKGKMSFIPSRVKGIKEVKKLFKKH